MTSVAEHRTTQRQTEYGPFSLFLLGFAGLAFVAIAGWHVTHRHDDKPKDTIVVDTAATVDPVVWGQLVALAEKEAKAQGAVDVQAREYRHLSTRDSGFMILTARHEVDGVICLSASVGTRRDPINGSLSVGPGEDYGVFGLVERIYCPKEVPTQ